MSNLNNSLKDGYISKVGDALVPYTAELKTGGYDATAVIANLAGAGVVITAADKVRESGEKTLTAAVASVHAIREGYYTQATTAVSLVEGILGKNHVLSIKLRSLRADLIGHQNPDGTPVTPEPLK